MNGPSKKMTGNAYARQALLPEGFRDQLAPHAEQEALLVRGLIDTFLSHGYDRVSPPVVEYEDSLLVGAGVASASQMFRVMDPDTQRMMAVRSDMTTQMARLAATRLADAPRPLRLAYSGSVLRTKGSQIRPAREFSQAGVELVGSNTVKADLEVVIIAVEALTAVGIERLSLDLTLAPLASLLCEQFGLADVVRDTIIEALDAKDASALAVLPSDQRTVFEQLLNATGEASGAITKLSAISLNGDAGQLVGQLKLLVALLHESLPELSVTIDPCETHGFEYKSGVGFAFFAKGFKSELGRGGRYHVVHPDGTQEEATGFSVYLDGLMAALPVLSKAEKLYIPAKVSLAEAKKLRAEGWRTIMGLTEGTDSRQEASQLGCSHIYAAGVINPL
ncbi:MAG: ATP phosphoribosyltransferase regulatory subunit [Kordiimonadaceae bacterium]|nr:ATP phosphoribosyltransferase regulatory subunit [Kordiimonadaceae bacterium]